MAKLGETCSGFKDFKVTSVQNTKKCFKHWQAAQKTEKEKWKWNNKLISSAIVT
jgi:hypothetical protein